MTLTVLLNPDFLNPKSTGLGIVEDYYTVLSFKLFRSGVFLLLR